MSMDDFLKELVKAFEGEASELLKVSSQCLMELEAAQDAPARGALYNKLGRALHTLERQRRHLRPGGRGRAGA